MARCVRRSPGVLLVTRVAVALCCLASFTGAAEVTVQNDSLTAGATGNVQVGFVAGESAAAWLTSPCDGNIVAVQVFWRSLLGGEPQSLEDSITIFDDGAFPVPGGQLAQILGPVVTDGVFNEYRYLDENQTIPLFVPVTNMQTFAVSFKFLNTPPPLGPSIVTDVDGCQSGKNGIFAVPGGWLNACLLGVTGDFVIRAIIDCNPTQACCFLPSGCLDLSAEDCNTAGGFPQGASTDCNALTCFPTGACCEQDGTCSDEVAATDCTAAGGIYQGDGSLCSSVTCPAPNGACCLSNDNCLDLPEADCDVIPNAFWAGVSTTCPDACDAPPAPPPCDNLVGAVGNRYVSAECPAAGSSEVLRIKFITLDGFSIPTQDFMYIGAPFPAPEEDTTQPGMTFTAAPLLCDPYFHDWGSVGPFALYGAEIVPSSEYWLQRADVACPNLADEACWSAPITLTTGKFGDVWPVWDWEMISAQPDFNDIAASVKKFQAAGPASAPIKTVVQVQPNTVFPLRPLDFKDIADIVKAFLGIPYSELYHGPCPCPPNVTCEVTACVNDIACLGFGDGLCVNGFCADKCRRCAP